MLDERFDILPLPPPNYRVTAESLTPVPAGGAEGQPATIRSVTVASARLKIVLNHDLPRHNAASNSALRKTTSQDCVSTIAPFSHRCSGVCPAYAVTKTLDTRDAALSSAVITSAALSFFNQLSML